MSDSGHCRHCVRGKDGRGHPYCNTLGDHDFHRRNGDGWWMDSWSACPACAEAEQIAEAIYDKMGAAGDSLPVGSGKFLAGYQSGLDAAAGIAIARDHP